MQQFLEYFLFIGQGLFITVPLLLGSVVGGLVGGTAVSILRYNKILVRSIDCATSFLRATPLMLQLSFVYFSVPTLIGVRLSILSAGVLTFSVNSSAYLAEIMRAGIQSIPQGQFEAAKALDIPIFYTWKDIILPQVMRAILPALVGEIIALLKETALISTIGGMDVMRMAQIQAAERFTYFAPLCMAGMYYYGLVLLIEWCGKKIEQRGSYDKN